MNTAILVTRTTQRAQGSWLGQVSQVLKSLLVANSEISLKTIVDPHGQTWYRAYDPKTRQTQWFTSETEVLAWLDSPASF